MIYRINDPVLRWMLMHPSNVFRMRDGMISTLAGEIFDQGWSTRIQLMFFRLAYRLLTVKHRLEARRAPTPAPAVSRSPG
jgi:hypothetical protein